MRNAKAYISARWAGRAARQRGKDPGCAAWMDPDMDTLQRGFISREEAERYMLRPLRSDGSR